MSIAQLALSLHAIPRSDASISAAIVSSTAYQMSTKSSVFASDNSTPPPTDFCLVLRPRHQPILSSSAQSDDDELPFAAAARHGSAPGNHSTGEVDDEREAAESGDAGRDVWGECRAGVVEDVGWRQEVEGDEGDGEGGEFDVHGRVLSRMRLAGGY